MTFEENLAALRGIEDVERIRIYRSGELLPDIPNAEGKRGSLQVYANLIGFENGTIDSKSAQRGLEIFDDARTATGIHPNIEILLQVVRSNEPVKAVIEYKIPDNLRERVEKFYAMKA